MQINFHNYKYDYQITSIDMPKEEVINIAQNIAKSNFNPISITISTKQTCVLPKEFLENCVITLTKTDND